MKKAGREGSSIAATSMLVVVIVVCVILVIFNILKTTSLVTIQSPSTQWISIMPTEVHGPTTIPGSLDLASGSEHEKFFILDAPEMSTWLIENHTQEAVAFYEKTLNEEAIEIWLHRGFERLTKSRTFDPKAAAAFVLPYYGHFSLDIKGRPDPTEFATLLLEKRIHNKTKPHILLCPSNNPARSRDVGIHKVATLLQGGGVNMWSVGIERNPAWQSVVPRKIIPIPYLVKPSAPLIELRERAVQKRKPSSVFYVGDQRPNAIRWSGCNRSMVEPLRDVDNMYVKLLRKGEERLSQAQYNQYMHTTDFCLIVCGDTPTSRSLASSVVHGCIPLRIGSRLRGLCEKPCKQNFGWKVTGPKAPHLPYAERIPWEEFPEVKEADFIKNPSAALHTAFDSISLEHREELREILARVLPGWIYGWGSPVTSNNFGEAAEFTWNSFLYMLNITKDVVR